MNVLDIILGAKKALEELGVKKNSLKITFDGNTEGLFPYFNQALYRVYDKYVDFTGLATLTLSVPEGSVTLSKAELVAEGAEITAGGIKAPEGFILAASLSPEDEYVSMGVIPEGVYLLSMDDMYVSAIEFEETIHPIDPKFIPGAVLPVVELSQETMAGIFSSGSAICTAEEHATIWAVYQALSPCIIRGNYEGMAFSGVSNILLSSEFMPYFLADAGATKMKIDFTETAARVTVEH